MLVYTYELFIPYFQFFYSFKSRNEPAKWRVLGWVAPLRALRRQAGQRPIFYSELDPSRQRTVWVIKMNRSTENALIYRWPQTLASSRDLAGAGEGDHVPVSDSPPIVF
jgi:hypothetical protein